MAIKVFEDIIITLIVLKHYSISVHFSSDRFPKYLFLLKLRKKSECPWIDFFSDLKALKNVPLFLKNFPFFRKDLVKMYNPFKLILQYQSISNLLWQKISNFSWFQNQKFPTFLKNVPLFFRKCPNIFSCLVS